MHMLVSIIVAKSETSGLQAQVVNFTDEGRVFRNTTESFCSIVPPYKCLATL